MSYRFFVWVSFLWIGFTFIFGLSSLDATGGLGTNSDLEAVMEFDLLSAREIMGLKYYLPNLSFFSGVIQMLKWDYPVFEGEWGYVRTFILYPLSVVTSLMLVIGITPIILNAASTLRNMFRL